MHSGKIVLAQLLEQVPHYAFRRIVARYGGDYRVRSFSCYKRRWQIELFFKWIKGHLRIKHFWGNSANAVKTQIWVAVAVYVLMAILKKEYKINLSLHAIHQILSANAFQKEPLHQLLTKDYTEFLPPRDPNQHIFNDL